MNTKILIPIVIIIAVLGGVALWWSNNQSSNSADENRQNTLPSPTPIATQPQSTASGTENQSQVGQEEYVVTLSDDGFEPANIVVPAGAEVRFVNQSNGAMWVASDPHPVHTDYSAFDQRQGGDEYAFTFTEAGAYTYHNHLNDSQTGIVLVE